MLQHPKIKSVRQAIGEALNRLGDKITPSEVSAYREHSYSQVGEDRILSHYFSSRTIERGYYVDIGAMHPFRYSNTALFHQLGWDGVCVEPNPHLAQLLREHRPTVTVVESAVSKESGMVSLITFPDMDALSTIDPVFANQQEEYFNPSSRMTIEVKCRPLAQILEEAAPPDEIQFFDIDVEGVDLEVLESNNWKRFRPEIVLIETSVKKKQIVDFMDSQNYSVLHDLGINIMFARNDQ